MTNALSIPRLRLPRHPSWYLFLLLPALPVLRLIARTGFEMLIVGGVDPTYYLLMTFVGVALAFGASGGIENLSWRARKEVDQLRLPVIGSIFLVQLGAMPESELGGLDIALFAASSALIAALPFGLEFQQRTLPNLLAQPVARTEWWSLKMRASGLSLLLHWTMLLFSRVSCGLITPVWLGIATLALAAMAWTTASYWTLLVRGLLAGFVFSLTVPLVTFAITMFLIDGLGLSGGPRVGLLTGDELWIYLMVYLAAPCYAIAGYLLGRRRWLALEAADHSGAEGGVLSLPTFRNPARCAATPRPVLTQLLGKEIRLQTATLLMGVATLVMGLFLLLPIPFFRAHEIMTQGSFSMLAATTILLAGASTVAEERRLGTLDSHHLLPVSMELQWCVKIFVASVIAMVAGAMIAASHPPVATQAGILDGLTGLLILCGLFVSAVLASAHSSNSLRALLVGGAIAAAGFCLASLLGHVAAQIPNWYNPVNRWVEIRSNLVVWRERVAALDLRQLALDGERIQSWGARMPMVFRCLMILPLGLGLALAWRTFRRPAGPRSRLGLHVLACYALILVLALAEWRTAWALNQRMEAVEDLAYAKRHVLWEQRITEAERVLYERYAKDPLDSINHTIRVPLGEGEVLRTTSTLSLPLSPDSRQVLLTGSNALPAELRTKLEQDAARDPRKPHTPPPAPPNMEEPMPPIPPGMVVDPALLKRYGLTVRTTAPGTVAPQAPGTNAKPGPGTFRMDPALMKRYGLIPRDVPVPGAAASAQQGPAGPAQTAQPEPQP